MTARNHHYIPEFYLAGFTPSGQKNDFLHVLGLPQARAWKCRPSNAGLEADFYSINHERLPRDFIEGELAGLESELAPLLAAIRSKKGLPADSDLRLFLNLVALLAARVPSVPEILDHSLSNVARRVFALYASSPERWDTMRSRLTRDGDPEPPTHEEAKEALNALNEGRVRMTLGQNHRVGMMLESANTIYPLLIPRTWSLLHTDPSHHGGFVTSDRPVALRWTTQSPPWSSPGFGMHDTEVILPLSPSLALYGIFGTSGAKDFEVPREVVAKINAIICAQSTRCIFSVAPAFLLWDVQEGVVCSERLLDRLRSLRVDERNQSQP